MGIFRFIPYLQYALALSVGLTSHLTQADFSGFDPSQFSNPAQLLSPSIINPVITGMGIAIDHRAFEPATSLGTNPGIDIGVELELVRIPDPVFTALELAGGSPVPTSSRTAPVARLRLDKGLSDHTSFGLSFIGYAGTLLYGFHIKYILIKPEEGLTWALRGSMGWAKVGFVYSRTITPALLVSRQMDFADPYIGLGYQFVTGSFDIPVVVGTETVHLTGDGSGSALTAFLGTRFRIAPMGFQITLEGGYSTGGANYLGSKLGFSF